MFLGAMVATGRPEVSRAADPRFMIGFSNPPEAYLEVSLRLNSLAKGLEEFLDPHHLKSICLKSAFTKISTFGCSWTHTTS